MVLDVFVVVVVDLDGDGDGDVLPPDLGRSRPGREHRGHGFKELRTTTDRSRVYLHVAVAVNVVDDDHANDHVDEEAAKAEP